MIETLLVRNPNQVELSSGRRVSFPLEFIDWTGVMAHFPVSAAAVRRLLPGEKLRPALLAPGTAIISIAAIEYRRLTDLAPYNEIAIMSPVLYGPAIDVPALPLLFPGSFGKSGFFVHRMAATTQDACELGDKVLGFPKLLAEIDFGEIDNLRRCRIRAGGQDVLTLDVKQAPAQIRRVGFSLYTTKDESLLRRRIETEGLYSVNGLPGGASVSFGDHPVGRELEALRVGKKAIGRVFGSNLRASLDRTGESLPL